MAWVRRSSSSSDDLFQVVRRPPGVYSVVGEDVHLLVWSYSRYCRQASLVFVPRCFVVPGGRFSHPVCDANAVTFGLSVRGWSCLFALVLVSLVCGCLYPCNDVSLVYLHEREFGYEFFNALVFLHIMRLDFDSALKRFYIETML